MDIQSGLRSQRLRQIANDLFHLRNTYPALTKREDGKYEGDILSFVKGLRISALLIYCLRDWLSDHPQWCVNWGHILSDTGQSCSPECDVIIHRGHVSRWNGDSEGDPVMDFRFVEASKALAVISCKSVVTGVDEDYPGQLRQYGVGEVLLFGESCSQSNFENLCSRARDAGYRGLWCSYFTANENDGPICDENVYHHFHAQIRSLVDAAPATP